MSSRKVLVFNRGEIAKRAAQACKKFQLESIWYAHSSEARSHLSANFDQVISDPMNGRETYTNLQQLKLVLERLKPDFLYPGYGFLSESPELSELCQKNGVQFLGPSSDVLEKCANKEGAQNLAQAHQIPTLRLTQSELQNSGGPFLIKASRGGGGRGHLVVNTLSEVSQGIEETRAKSIRLFNSDLVHVEKYITHARHIEAQVICDGVTPAKLLGTRDCTVQRSFQKVIEEGEVGPQEKKAVQDIFPHFQDLLKSVGYKGLLTLEFVWDFHTEKLYFIEMNCRIQVEHPVTEKLLDINLVEEQFALWVLPNHQSTNLIGIDRSRGHAIECRIYAEDPLNQFLPHPGKIEFLETFHQPFVRWDWSLAEGESVLPDFDPMIGKLVVWGQSRLEAIQRSIEALQGLVIHGPKTNQELLIEILREPLFMNREHHTRWLDDFVLSWKPQRTPFAIPSNLIKDLDRSSKMGIGPTPQSSIWKKHFQMRTRR